MEFRISLTGDIGSGKSTVGKILSEKYGAKIYSTGPIVRQIAEERGITVVDINKFMETDPHIDHDMDNRLIKLSDEPGSLIIDSRMAWHFTRNTFRVYLTTAVEESARRVYSDKRSSETFASEAETAEQIRNRKKSENMRYLKLYGANCGYMGNYDLVIDTTAAPATAAAELISMCYEKMLAGERWVKFYMYGGRLLPTFAVTGDDIKTALDTKDKPLIAPIPIIVNDCDYYIATKEAQLDVLRCVAAGNNHIPCSAEFVNEAPVTAEDASESWKHALGYIKNA